MLALPPFAHTAFDRLIGWIPSAELLLQWAGPLFTYPLDREQLDRYLRESQGDPPTRLIFTAVEAGTDAAVGHIEIAKIDPRNRSATLSRVLVGDPSRRGRGTGVAMVRQALAIGFDRLG